MQDSSFKGLLLTQSPVTPGQTFLVPAGWWAVFLRGTNPIGTLATGQHILDARNVPFLSQAGRQDRFWDVQIVKVKSQPLVLLICAQVEVVNFVTHQLIFPKVTWDAKIQIENPELLLYSLLGINTGHNDLSEKLELELSRLLRNFVHRFVAEKKPTNRSIVTRNMFVTYFRIRRIEFTRN